MDAHAVIAGIGTNDTARTIRLAREAQNMGADGGLVILRTTISQARGPLCAPRPADAAPDTDYALQRTGEPNLRLRSIQSLDWLRCQTWLLSRCDSRYGVCCAYRRGCGSNLSLLSGDDIAACPMVHRGPRCRFGQSNLLPNRMVEMWSHFNGGDLGAARRIHTQLLPLFDGLFTETNPVPVKRLWPGTPASASV